MVKATTQSLPQSLQNANNTQSDLQFRSPARLHFGGRGRLLGGVAFGDHLEEGEREGKQELGENMRLRRNRQENR